MDKKLYTNEDLFYIILNQLKKEGLVPSILEYSLGCSRHVTQVKTDEWDAIGRINFGTNEGIFLTVYMEGNINKGVNKVELGTFKTLDNSKEAYKAMSDLNVEFVFALRDFVEKNPDSFCWTGYTVRYVTNGTPSTFSTWCASYDSVIKNIKRHFSSNSATESITVIDNGTNKEQIYKREDVII